MGQKRIRKPRSKVRPRPQIIHEDSRTQRQRRRGDAERAEILRELEELHEDLEEALLEGEL